MSWSSASRYRLASSGLTQPRTQKVTPIGLSAGSPEGMADASTGGPVGTGNAVADDDGVIGNEDLLDDQAHDALPLENVERVGGRAQSAEKCR